MRRNVSSHSPHSTQILQSCFDDIHARIRIVGPIDGDLMNPVPGFFCEEKHFGIKEPIGVFNMRQNDTGNVGTHCFKTTLSIGEMC